MAWTRTRTHTHMHMGMAMGMGGLYHLTGLRKRSPSERIIRASVGVISGRSVTRLPSLSTKLYIWSVISSPALRS